MSFTWQVRVQLRILMGLESRGLELVLDGDGLWRLALLPHLLATAAEGL